MSILNNGSNSLNTESGVNKAERTTLPHGTAPLTAQSKDGSVQKIILATLILTFFTFHQHLHAQVFGLKKLNKLTDHSKFEWITDTIDASFILYFEPGSYADQNLLTLRERIKYHIHNTLLFVGIDTYDQPIHYFLVENREKMRLLVGCETYGTTHHKEHYVVAVHSEKKKMAYLNHELFHLIAMNAWGQPERWINEGMAVYSDRYLNGYPLHQISKYLIDQNQYIPLSQMAKRLRKFDSQITYPLLGSFAQYIDETYGRETTLSVWTAGRKGLKSQVGKSLESLEAEWLEMLDSITYEDIDYLK